MKWVFIFPVILFMAQSQISDCQNIDTLNYKARIIKFTPSSLLNIDFPSFDFSLECLNSPKHSIEFTLGYGFMHPYYIHADTQFATNMVFKSSIEFKFYRPYKFHKTSISRTYISLQPFFQFRQFNNALYFTTLHDTTFTSNLDNFSEQEYVFGFNVKTGREIQFSNRFVIDYWIGAGVKYRYAHGDHMNFDFKNMIVRPDGINVPRDLLRSPGFTFNLPLGFKIGYIL